MKNCVLYIGDFDFRNENVQAHLVKNNGMLLNSLGYHIEYVGINRRADSFEVIQKLSPIILDNDNCYYELPETLNIKGLFKTFDICRAIIAKLDELKKLYKISYIITYQSPTYAIAIKRIATWCKRNRTPYIVNCADLPIFDAQSPLRKIVMKRNWDYMHKVNYKYADGVIAVSKYIAEFYHKSERPSVVIPPLYNYSAKISGYRPNDITTFIYTGTPFKVTGYKVNTEGMKDRLDKIIDLFIALSSKDVTYKLNIVGISKVDYLTGVPRHRNALADNQSICFFGKRSHKETLSMISASDFSINYRDNNLMTKAGFSTKIVESVSLGTPVVINDISDTYYYLQDGFSGYKLTDSIEDNVSLIHKLCTFSCSDRASLKKALVDEQIFAYTKYADRMKQFLESVLARK